MDGEVVCRGGDLARNAPPGRHTAISVGVGRACAVAESGEAVCWGNNARSRGAPPGRYTAITVNGGEDGNYACALTIDGEARCWSAYVGDPPPGRYIAVAAGDAHACALTEDGAAVCWGRPRDWHDFGQTDPPPGRYTAISAGSDRTCAITLEGAIVCWGDTDYELRPIPPL